MRACIEEQLQGAYGIEEEEPQPPVSAAQVGVLTDSEAQRVAQQWAQAPAGAGGGGGEQQAAGTGQFAGGTQQGLPQAIMDGFHSGEGFGSPLGQPQSMLAIQVGCHAVSVDLRSTARSSTMEDNLHWAEP